MGEGLQGPLPMLRQVNFTRLVVTASRLKSPIFIPLVMST